MAEAGATCRLLITLLTPSICAASLAAALRSMSLPTLPLRVTTPLFASITTLLATLLSALTFFCTSAWTCESERPPNPEREQPTVNNARETRATQKYLLIVLIKICSYFGSDRLIGCRAAADDCLRM